MMGAMALARFGRIEILVSIASIAGPRNGEIRRQPWK